MHYLYGGIIVLILAFAAWYTKIQHDAGYNDAAAIYEARIKKGNEIHAVEVAEAQKTADQIAAAWLASKPQVEIRYKTIIEKVPVYVQNNPVCDLALGAVWLLNESADPDGLQPDHHPTITKAEAAAASTVTQPAQIEHCIGWAKQYNELSDQMNALIDAIEIQEGEKP